MVALEADPVPAAFGCVVTVAAAAVAMAEEITAVVAAVVTSSAACGGSWGRSGSGGDGGCGIICGGGSRRGFVFPSFESPFQVAIDVESVPNAFFFLLSLRCR